MSAMHRSLGLDVPLGLALRFISMNAAACGQPEAAAAAERLAQTVDGMVITAQVPIVHVLCQAADHLRAEGHAPLVAKLEEIVKLLKAPMGPRLITGSLHLNAVDERTLDQRLEQLRTSVLRQAGG